MINFLRSPHFTPARFPTVQGRLAPADMAKTNPRGRAETLDNRARCPAGKSSGAKEFKVPTGPRVRFSGRAPQAPPIFRQVRMIVACNIDKIIAPPRGSATARAG